MYRAMAAKHRWVAVLDLDEYILPKPEDMPNWLDLLQQIIQSKGGKAAAEYSFSGVKLCSGCVPQPAEKLLMLDQKDVPAACQQPLTVGFHHITWPSALLPSKLDQKKSIVDPRAVGQAGVHSTEVFSAYSLSSGSTSVPRTVAVKLHDRVHDIHQDNITFASRMLPLLKSNIARVAALTADGRFDQMAGLQVWPAHNSNCDVCGSVKTSEMGSPRFEQDLKLCSLYGEQLRRIISADAAAMLAAGTFDGPDGWASKDPRIANLYGGHVFTKWAPPS
jgi:hypothetical protein